MSYDASEQDVIAAEFNKMLRSCTKDGGKKRLAGEKLPWWCDPTHEAAIFSHLNKWKHGELVDADSGAHPLVHLAWRALAIAYQETHGLVEPGCGSFHSDPGASWTPCGKCGRRRDSEANWLDDFEGVPV